jgi:hypothetical protein
MDLKKFRQIIKEEVRQAIQEELKGIITEAIIIASTPEQKTKTTPQPYTKTESMFKPKFSEVMAENKTSISTGNPILDLLNETANDGEWKNLNGGYNASDAVGWNGGAPNIEGINTPVVSTVNQMISNQSQVRDINDVRIDAVPDFTGLMNKLKENGKL